MISQAPLTNSSSDLIPGSKRQKNLYLNLVHFNSTPEVPWEKNWIKVRQADSTAWKMNLSRCFWNMYLPCARAWEGEKENVIRLNNSLSSGGALLLTTQHKKRGAWVWIHWSWQGDGQPDRQEVVRATELTEPISSIFSKWNMQGN